MKQIYLIGGTMGIGKTTVCQKLKMKLDNSVFLDGDWCWDMNPFVVTEETKEMVLENICFLLNRFIQCSAYRNIIFCWVMHKQEIIDHIVCRLNTKDCNIHKISLVCKPEILKIHLEQDISRGVRTDDIIEKAMERLQHYQYLDTQKVDVSAFTPDEAVVHIIENC